MNDDLESNACDAYCGTAVSPVAAVSAQSQGYCATCAEGQRVLEEVIGFHAHCAACGESFAPDEIVFELEQGEAAKR